jgi:hypothetical protein
MKEISLNDDVMNKLIRMPEPARVLELADATSIRFHTDVKGTIDGTEFRFLASSFGGKLELEAEFVLIQDRKVTATLAVSGPESWRHVFNLHFDDLLKEFSKSAAALGYWSVQLEYGRRDLAFRICLGKDVGNDPAIALLKMKSDIPEIRRLFDAMNAEALRRLIQRQNEMSQPGSAP